MMTDANDDDDDLCAICMDSMKEMELVYPPCGHRLHQICYHELQQNHISACPTCRRNISFAFAPDWFHRTFYHCVIILIIILLRFIFLVILCLPAFFIMSTIKILFIQIYFGILYCILIFRVIFAPIPI